MLSAKEYHAFFSNGEMAEWFKAHDWSSCGRDERPGGSNPSLSATFLIMMADSLSGSFGTSAYRTFRVCSPSFLLYKSVA